MRFCIQVVKQASVDIDGERVSSIGPGMLVLAGIGKEDDEKTADKMIAKLLKMRIFSDANGKTNLSLADIDGEMLLYPSLLFMQTANTATDLHLRTAWILRELRNSTIILPILSGLG